MTNCPCPAMVRPLSVRGSYLGYVVLGNEVREVFLRCVVILPMMHRA